MSGPPAVTAGVRWNFFRKLPISKEMKEVSMSNPSHYAMQSAAVLDAKPMPTRYLARQPILDVQGNVVAYELLYRCAGAAAFSGAGDMATRTVIDNTLIYGLTKISAGLPAFINCTVETLTGEEIEMLPALSTVLEVLESVEVSDEVVEACVNLRRKGYRLALDDFEYSPSFDPLIRIADFIKIDFRSTPAPKRRELISRLHDFRGMYLAEKVETHEEVDLALQEGFTLFQGYYFCKPLLLKRSTVPSNRHVHFRLLRLMQENPLNIAEVAHLLKEEPSLSYRLLRYVNSAGLGVREEIDSLERAVLFVGDDHFRRMATLAIAVELNSESSPEILRIALARARFCEMSAHFCNLHPAEQYLLGLFSLLDAMLQTSMEEALAPLMLPVPIRSALLGVDNPNRCPLTWLQNHEYGDFERCEALAGSHGLASELLEQNFIAATRWADELLAES